jgi:hypothetical protein
MNNKHTFIFSPKALEDIDEARFKHMDEVFKGLFYTECEQKKR